MYVFGVIIEGINYNSFWQPFNTNSAHLFSLMIVGFTTIQTIQYIKLSYMKDYNVKIVNWIFLVIKISMLIFHLYMLYYSLYKY